MKKNIFIGILIILSIVAKSQTIDNRIVVIGESTIEMPADQIVFNIRLNYKDSSDVKIAFEKHKIAENKLINFLKELNIPNKNINYSLINIGQIVDFQNNNDRKILYGTNQNISIKIDDIKQSTDFMLKLISAGFNEISTTFKSSKENDFHDKLIEKAIESAKRKALVMAKVSNRKISKILKVADTDESDPNFGYYESVAMAAEVGYGNQIIEIPQTITKSMKVKVVFGLQ